METLTVRQQAVLDFIRGRQEVKGCASIDLEALGDPAGYRSTAVWSGQ